MGKPNLRRRLKAIREDLTWVTQDVWFYNLDNHRGDKQVALELTALAAEKPAIIALCEVVGNKLPDLPGYTLVQDASTRSRLNIAAYVRDDLPLRGHRWVDLKGTWPRTKGSGTHEPRSYLVLQVGRIQVLVAHQPPKNARHAWVLQIEGVNALVKAMLPQQKRGWRVKMVESLRPRIVLWDANRRSGEAGPGPDTLAKKIAGTVHGGNRIDNAVTRGDIEVLSVVKRGRVSDVELQSDHKGAVRFRLRVRSCWLS